MQWSIEIAGSGSELKEFMCALVQHFHCPLSSNIISGVLKSFNSEELQREQWTVSSEQWRITATVIHEESSSVCGQGELQWCLRVFYSPFWRRISTRIAYVIVDNPTSSFDLHTTFTQVSSFSQWGLHGSSFPKSSFGCALLQMIRLPFGDVQSCFEFSRGLLVSTLESPYHLRCHLDILPCYSYLIALVRVFASIIFHVHLVISIRSVD